MKKCVLHTLQRVAVMALILTGVPAMAQKESPEAALNDLQSDAYVAQKKAAAAEKEGNYRAALDLYEIALETYIQVQTLNPEHEAKTIRYRIADLTQKKAAVTELIKEAGGPDPEMAKKHERLLSQYEKLVDEHEALKKELEQRPKKGTGTDFVNENLKLDNLMLKEKVAELARKVGAADPETANKIRVLEEQIDAHRSNSERLQKMVGDLTRDRDTLRSQMEKAGQNDAALKEARKAWDAERSKLEADLAAARKAADMAGKSESDATKKQAATIKTLESDLAKARAASQQASEAARKAEATAKAATADLKKHSERVDQLDALLVQSRTETMKARTDAEGANERLAKLGPDAKRAGALREELTELQTQLKARNAAHALLEKQHKDTQKEFKKVQASIAELQKLSDRHAANAQTAQAEIKELKLTNATLENEQKSYVAKLKEWEKNGLDAAGISDEVRKKLAGFSAKEADWTQKTADLEAKLRAESNNAKAYKSGLLAADKRMKELEDAHGKAAGQVASLTQKLEKESSEKRLLGETYAALRKEHAADKKALASADRDRESAVRQTTQRLEETESELVRVRNEAAKSQADLKTLGQAHAAAQRELNAMKKADNPLTATVADLEKQLADRLKHTRMLEGALQDKDIALASSTQAVKAGEAALAQARQSVKAMKEAQTDSGAAKALAQVEKLNRDLQTLQAKLTEQERSGNQLKQELGAARKQLAAKGDPAKKLADLNKRLAEANSARKQADARAAESQAAIKRLEDQVKDQDKTIAQMRKAPAAPKADPKVAAELKAQLAASQERIAALEQTASQHQAALDASERKRQAVIRVLDQKVRERKALEEKLKAATGNKTSMRLPTPSMIHETLVVKKKS